ncbi:Mth938-like domain-containing protein [Candidatus Spongiihabitans sp.]|uniref:Mth938-like domain-containing protein n=1 Tax=Candidatus Spongiihabitans sp. TaxID=3101308 RepID=UPI003C7E1D04
MKLVLNQPEQLQIIRACEKIGHRYQIRIGDTLYQESIILTPQKLEMWPISQVSDLKNEDFVHFANLGAEVLILGTGATMVFPDPVITQALMAKGIGMEVMDTAAACRTYNILLSDGRSVVAGLML